MKLLKMFQSKMSPLLTSVSSSRTSSSSSNASTSPHSSDFSSREIQKASSDHEKSPSNSRRKGTAKKNDTIITDDVGHGVPRLGHLGVDHEHQELADAFKIFDRNGDGKISVSELGEILRSIGDDLSHEDLQLMVQAVDADGDGCINLQEFIDLNRAAGHGPGTASRSEELRAAFHVFDIDKNNYISAEELHQVLCRLGQPSLTIEECCRMIDGVDSNGDGMVDFSEFERMMTNNCVF